MEQAALICNSSRPVLLRAFQWLLLTQSVSGVGSGHKPPPMSDLTVLSPPPVCLADLHLDTLELSRPQVYPVVLAPCGLSPLRKLQPSLHHSIQASDAASFMRGTVLPKGTVHTSLCTCSSGHLPPPQCPQSPGPAPLAGMGHSFVLGTATPGPQHHPAWHTQDVQ